MSTLLISIAIFLILLSSVTDLLYYRIPNSVVGALFVLFPLFTLSMGQAITFQPYLLFLLVLICGASLFYFNLIGGGDAKLLSVVALWIGWAKILSFFILMGIIGGLLSLLILAMPKVIKRFTKKARHFIGKQRMLKPLVNCFICESNKEVEQDILEMQQEHMVPYAIAISAAAIIML
ncbi:MAG: prepilin peptidase [Alphaproteobacteria bacterium]